MESRHDPVIAPDKMDVIYQSHTCTVRRYADEKGTLVRAEHSVFPGITLLYKDYRRGECTFHVTSPPPNILSIEHCLEGQVEFQMNEESFFLTAGDVVLRRTDGAKRSIHFPSKAYQGLHINVDLEEAPRCLTCILEDVDVNPETLVQKFGLEGNPFHYLRKNDRLIHIFKEFYAIPESICTGYLKLKVLEILLFLSGMELPEQKLPKRRTVKSQILTAQKVHSYLEEHTNEHITIAELSRRFGTSQTQLKDSFRNIYGTTVQGFICEQKMRAAAQVLLQTDRKIAEIASEFGYMNASKFANAFRRIMGCSPAQYRLKEE